MAKRKALKVAVAIGVGFAAAHAAAASGTELLRERDTAYRHGTIRFVFDLGSVTDGRGRVLPPIHNEGTLTFSGDRYLEKLDQAANLGADVRTYTFVQGDGYRYTEVESTGGVRVTFAGSDGDFPRIEDPRFRLSSHPCFPLALGLGKMSQATAQATSEGQRFSGDLGAGTTAVLEVNRSWVPQRLELDHGGRPNWIWTYSGSLPKTGGLFLPQEARMSVPVLNGKGNCAYKFLSANLDHEPTERDLSTPWFRPGVEVTDRRVNPMVVWTYESLKRANGGSDSLTPQRLLELSQERSGYFADQQRIRAKKIEAAKARSNSGSLTLYGLFFGLPILGWIGVTLFKKPKPR